MVIAGLGNLGLIYLVDYQRCVTTCCSNNEKISWVCCNFPLCCSSFLLQIIWTTIGFSLTPNKCIGLRLSRWGEAHWSSLWASHSDWLDLVPPGGPHDKLLMCCLTEQGHVFLSKKGRKCLTAKWTAWSKCAGAITVDYRSTWLPSTQLPSLGRTTVSRAPAGEKWAQGNTAAQVSFVSPGF